ncbi:MAG: ribbon-helix-helix protein, CopG family [Alphaproteobacteria bacterium]|nr:ribbon-helix-helix protein, CopG family [Alphaproteobacteria bacterium]
MLNIRIPETVGDSLEEVARTLGQTKAKIARRAIREFIEGHVRRVADMDVASSDLARAKGLSRADRTAIRRGIRQMRQGDYVVYRRRGEKSTA